MHLCPLYAPSPGLIPFVSEIFCDFFFSILLVESLLSVPEDYETLWSVYIHPTLVHFSMKNPWGEMLEPIGSKKRKISSNQEISMLYWKFSCRLHSLSNVSIWLFWNRKNPESSTTMWWYCANICLFQEQHFSKVMS